MANEQATQGLRALTQLGGSTKMAKLRNLWPEIVQARRHGVALTEIRAELERAGLVFTEHYFSNAVKRLRKEDAAGKLEKQPAVVRQTQSTRAPEIVASQKPNVPPVTGPALKTEGVGEPKKFSYAADKATEVPKW